MKTLKSGVAALLSFFSLTEFSLNQENNIELSIDDAINLNDHITDQDEIINEQKSQIDGLNTKNTDLENKIKDLEAKISGTAVEDTTEKGNDIKPKNENDFVEISDEMSEKLMNYNKANNPLNK